MITTSKEFPLLSHLTILSVLSLASTSICSSTQFKDAHLFQLINCPRFIAPFSPIDTRHFISLLFRRDTGSEGGTATVNTTDGVVRALCDSKGNEWRRLLESVSRLSSLIVIAHQPSSGISELGALCHAHTPTRLKQWALSNLLLLLWQVTSKVRRLHFLVFPCLSACPTVPCSAMP